MSFMSRSLHAPLKPSDLWAIIPRAQKSLCFYQARGSEDWGARRSTGASLSHAFDATLVGGSKTFFWRFYTRMFAPDTQVACKTRFANVSRHIVAPTSKCTLFRYALIFRRCASSCACGRASIALWRPAKAETVSCAQWLAAHGCDKKLLKGAFYHWQQLIMFTI